MIHKNIFLGFLFAGFLFSTSSTQASGLFGNLLFSSQISVANTAKDKPEKIKLALNWKAESEFGGFYAALIEGLFEKQGLHVEIQEGGSGTPTVQMLASNQIEFAIVSGDEIIIAHDRGATDITALFATFQTSPVGVMTHADKKFKSLKEALQSEGTILWSAGLPWTQYVSKVYAPIKVKSAPYNGGVGIFLKDKNVMQQCFVISEPLLAQEAKADVKTFSISESGFNPYTVVLATNVKYLQKEPEKVAKFVKAVRDGWRLYLDNPEKTNQYMAGLNKSISLEMHKKMAEAQKPLIENKDTQKNGLGTMSKERWQKLVNQLHEIMVIKTKPKVENLYQM